MTNIRLEDDYEASWDDAKTRLKVATEIFGFPFFIVMDYAAYAYKDMNGFMEDGEIYPEDEQEAVTQWWKEYAQEATDYHSALRILYPWFHGGKEMAYRTTLSPLEFALSMGQLGFSYVETSCHSTTYRRGNDLLSIEDPDTETFVDLEIATDFRLTPEEQQHLKVTK